MEAAHPLAEEQTRWDGWPGPGESQLCLTLGGVFYSETEVRHGWPGS